jgi:hypothetical protein
VAEQLIKSQSRFREQQLPFGGACAMLVMSEFATPFLVDKSGFLPNKLSVIHGLLWVQS